MEAVEGAVAALVEAEEVVVLEVAAAEGMTAMEAVAEVTAVAVGVEVVVMETIEVAVDQIDVGEAAEIVTDRTDITACAKISNILADLLIY